MMMIIIIICIKVIIIQREQEKEREGEKKRIEALKILFVLWIIRELISSDAFFMHGFLFFLSFRSNISLNLSILRGKLIAIHTLLTIFRRRCCCCCCYLILNINDKIEIIDANGIYDDIDNFIAFCTSSTVCLY